MVHPVHRTKVPGGSNFRSTPGRRASEFSHRATETQRKSDLRVSASKIPNGASGSTWWTRSSWRGRRPQPKGLRFVPPAAPSRQPSAISLQQKKSISQFLSSLASCDMSGPNRDLSQRSHFDQFHQVSNRVNGSALPERVAHRKEEAGSTERALPTPVCLPTNRGGERGVLPPMPKLC